MGHFRKVYLPPNVHSLGEVPLASHTKPWSACTHVERLDPFNGLMLTPNLDGAFDGGLVTFDAAQPAGRCIYRDTGADKGPKGNAPLPI